MFDSFPSVQRTLIDVRTRIRAGAAHRDAGAAPTRGVTCLTDDAVPEFTAVALRAHRTAFSLTRSVELTWTRVALEIFTARETPCSATVCGHAENASETHVSDRACPCAAEPRWL